MASYDPKAFYDAMSKAYDEKTSTGVWNEMYDRPNVIALIPEANILDVLEVGCGSGGLTKWLVNQEYHVSAFDISPKLLKIAQGKVGAKAKLFVADAAKPLTMVSSNSVDLIISSLVFHYIEDWDPLFKELKRVLRSSGSIVFSTHHPHADWIWCEKENYFTKEMYEETWTIAGHPYLVQYYHRTLMEMFEIFKKNGFYVDELKEPFPLPEVKKIDLKTYEKLTSKPNFLYFRLKKQKIAS
ncbi:class I SAM-dependent methyltransferase [Candidatus Lokiarchaeum ossiferum]|uniref:class I SAM-dependent methyltransferase n=1 Tax=Candidatus Lokiarchaeum ossiferum TaxID=2951803 RepID=UPI00352FBA6E